MSRLRSKAFTHAVATNGSLEMPRSWYVGRKSMRPSLGKYLRLVSRHSSCSERQRKRDLLFLENYFFGKEGLMRWVLTGLLLLVLWHLIRVSCNAEVGGPRQDATDSLQPLPPTRVRRMKVPKKSNDFLSIDSPIDSHGLETLAIGSDISSAELSPTPTPPPSPVAARRSASRKNKKVAGRRGVTPRCAIVLPVRKATENNSRHILRSFQPLF